MCLTYGNGSAALWGEYMACVATSVNWQSALQTMPSERLTLVVPCLAGARTPGCLEVNLFLMHDHVTVTKRTSSARTRTVWPV